MTVMQEALDEVRKRCEVASGQALQMIAMAKTASDTENRLALLSMAKRQIGDDRVFDAWVSLVEEEGDPELRRSCLDVVARAVTGKQMRPAQLSRLRASIPTLAECCGEDSLRDSSSLILGALATFAPEAGSALVQAYRGLKSGQSRTRIVKSLAALRYRWDGVSDFLKEILHEVDFEDKAGIVNFLLWQGALSEREEVDLLSETEPDAVRLSIIRFCNDRSDAVGAELAQAIAGLATSDCSMNCRLEAALFLETRLPASPETIGIFLDLLHSDASPAVRQAAEFALGRTVSMNPDLVSQLEQTLKKEHDQETFLAILRFLRPYASSRLPVGERVRSLIFALLDMNLQVSLSRYLYEILEDALLAFPELSDKLLDQAERLHDARIKAALLETVALGGSDREGFASLFSKACRSASPELRNAAAAGLLALPLTVENTAVILPALDLLADPAVDPRRKVRLGKKIAHIPSFSVEDTARIKLLLEGFNASSEQVYGFEDMKRSLAEAIERSRPAGEYDWELWRNRVHNEKSTLGIFPAIYAAFREFPDEATSLLKAILTSTDRHSRPAFERDPAILTFLQAWDRVDDEVSRFAMDFLLTKDVRYGDVDFYLALLKSNLSFPELKTGLWRVLERSIANARLLLEVLWLAYDRDGAVADALFERAKSKTSGKELKPYLEFLAGNQGWSRCGALVKEITSFLEPMRPESEAVLKRKPGLLDE